MTEQPSAYDILQDHRLDALDELVTPYYQPPGDVEYSFPVVGQGITADQYRLMSLSQGDGIIVTDDGEYSHWLENLPGGPSETNAQNQLVLKVAQGTGRAESVLGGSYHVLYEDKRLDFPPVTTPTTYHVCITRDPRKEEDPSGPLFVEVYAGVPPKTHGRTHILLETVHREPNQLLTDATRQAYRQMTAPTIAVAGEDRLPDPMDLAYNTVAFLKANTDGTGGIWQARGVNGWRNLLVGPWQSFGPHTGNEWAGEGGKARRRLGGVDVWFNINRGNQHGNPTAAMFNLPTEFAVSRSFYATSWSTLGPVNIVVSSDGSGRQVSLGQIDTRPPWVRGSFFIPDDFLLNP